MKLKFKRLAVASLLASLGASALATNYFYVQPKSGEMSKLAPFSVVLGAYTLPGATVGLAYNGTGYDLAPLASVSGDPALNKSLVTFALTSGNLPAGLALSAAGIISGTPTEVGGGVVQVTASYKNASGAQSYTVVSVNLTVALAAATLPTGNVGLAYNNGTGFDFATVLSAPGDTAFNASLATFALTSGSLPPGLTLSTAGKLTGTPTAASANTTLQVTASYKTNSGSQNYTWVAIAPTTLSVINPTFTSTPVGGSSNPQTVTITNTTAQSATISAVTSSSGDFTVNATGCTSSVLAGNSSCTVTVVFNPTVAGGRSGTLAIVSNAANSPLNVNLSATATNLAFPTTAGLISSTVPGTFIGNQASSTVLPELVSSSVGGAAVGAYTSPTAIKLQSTTATTATYIIGASSGAVKMVQVVLTLNGTAVYAQSSLARYSNNVLTTGANSNVLTLWANGTNTTVGAGGYGATLVSVLGH